MKAFVITFAVFNAIGLLVSLRALGLSEPWPRARPPKDASTEVLEVVVHIGIIAWGLYLVWPRA